MAFKAKASTLTFDANKRYFWRIAALGNGVNHWGYVSNDTPAAMEISGYFNDPEIIAVAKPGDRLTVWHVDSISDLRTLQDDFVAGINALLQTLVVANDGAGVQVAPMTERWSMEYTLP
jgi:hypothetical protein